jgi:hypothetical protein
MSAKQQTVYVLPSKGAGYEALRKTKQDVSTAQAYEVLLKIHASVNIAMSQANIKWLVTDKSSRL